MDAVANRGDPDGREPRRVLRGFGEQVVQHLHYGPPFGHHRWHVEQDAVPAAAGEEGVAGSVHQRCYIAVGTREGCGFESDSK